MAQTVIIPSAAQTSVIKCKLCDSTGEFFCKECPSALCKPCREKHDKLLGDHEVVNIKTIDRSSFTISCNTQCSLHHQPFKLFCNECELLICIDCVAEDHKGHSFSRIEKVVEKLKESAYGKLSIMKERIGKLSEAIGKIKSEKLPQLAADLQYVTRDMYSTFVSIQQVIEAKKDIKTNEYDDFKKLQDLDIQKELRRRENVLDEYRNICSSIEKMVTEDHSVTFFISFNNIRRDIDEFDDEILKDIDLPIVPKFKHDSFAEEIINALCSKLEVRLINTDGLEEEQRRTDKLTEDYASTIAKCNAQILELNNQKEVLEQKTRNLEDQVALLENKLSNNASGNEQEIQLLKLELSNIRDASYNKRNMEQDLLRQRILMLEKTSDKYHKENEDYKAKILTATNTIANYQREIEGLRKPVVCKYVCSLCSYVTTSSVSQGQAPIPQSVWNCRCGYNRPFTYSGAAS